MMKGVRYAATILAASLVAYGFSVLFLAALG